MSSDIDCLKQTFPILSNFSLIKKGGQRCVYDGIHPEFGDIVVKINLPGITNERFVREIEIVSSNSFPNVPRIFQHGSCSFNSKESYFVFEQKITGEDLRRRLLREKRIGYSEGILMIGSLLKTLVALEGKGIIHRDIKPDNILCSTDGEFWLIDFGIARDPSLESLTQTQANFGPHTLGYASPEQFRNYKKKLDSRSDLFSLGIVAYEALTGTQPFYDGARDRLEIIQNTEIHNIAAAQIDGDQNGKLSSFIKLLMEKYPSRRPPSSSHAYAWFSEEFLT